METMAETNRDFRLEKRLRLLNPELHRRFADTVTALNNGLSKYKRFFPEYTDHSILHSMNVIGFCNRLIADRIDALNADEIYILLMSCYLHDAGMGISVKDYENFSARIDFGDYFETHSRGDIPELIRAFHQEFSGQYIHRYAGLFEIPSPEHEQAIIRVVRGHRRTDLMDENVYPAEFRLPNGNTVCLPYLAAMIRLADEVDVAADRNLILLYDIRLLTDEYQIMVNKTVQAIRRMEISDSAFTLEVSTEEGEISALIRKVAEKIQSTLDYCRKVVNNRTPYMITQEKVLIRNQPNFSPERTLSDVVSEIK